MKTKLFVALAVLAALLAVAVPVSAQTIPGLFALDKISKGDPFNFADIGDNNSVAALICYAGSSSAGGTVTVSTNNTITLKTGPVSGSSADTSVECPLSGGYGGVIDGSNAACDTWGELANVVNSTSGSNWRIVLIDAAAADNVANTNARIVDKTETAANDCDAGLPIYVTTSVTGNFFEQRALLTPAQRKLGYYLDNRSKQLISKPFGGYQTVLTKANSTSTYASGTSLQQVLSESWSCTGTNSCTFTADGIQQSQPSGATTVNQQFTLPDFGLFLPKGSKGFVKILNSAAIGTTTLVATGQVFKY